ncbi:MAG: response regulator [Acidimicrobiia bacterium]|nr:response regulator [Acidimicrobiia bacterium]
MQHAHTRTTDLDTADVTPRRPLRVLLVDDDANVLAMLQAVLTSRTLDVVGLASNGEDAERVAAAIAPDVAVVDYMMPGLTGLQTATRIKAIHPQCIVVIFSALADMASEAEDHPDVDRFVAKTDIAALDALIDDMRSARSTPD